MSARVDYNSLVHLLFFITSVNSLIYKTCGTNIYLHTIANKIVITAMIQELSFLVSNLALTWS